MIKHIAKYLTLSGVGTYGDYQDGNVFYGYLPQEPKSAICVYSTNKEVSYWGGKDISTERIQILVRDESYDTTQNVTNSIIDILANKSGKITKSICITKCWLLNKVDLGKTDSTFITSMNFKINY